MKKFLALAVFFLSVKISDGQVQIPIDSSTGRVSYTEIVYADSTLKKKDLFKKAIEWVALNYNSANDVIQLKDEESGKIIVKGNMVVVINPMGFVFERRLKHTITIDTRDGRCRINITDFRGEFKVSSQYETTLEQEIECVNVRWKKKPMFQKFGLELLTNCDKEIHRVLDSFSNYIQKPTDKKKDDW